MHTRGSSKRRVADEHGIDTDLHRPVPSPKLQGTAMAIVLNVKQEIARASKMERKAIEMRAELWRDVPEEFLWDRKKSSKTAWLFD